MVQYREYRVTLPFTVEEYKLAQLYMVAKYSASESGGSSGDGVEVLKNEPYENEAGRGQYTHKMYHLASKLPSWLVSLVPKKALVLEEEAWNAYPHCLTVLRCPALGKFSLTLETMHLPDRGDTENALKMDAKTLKKRQVEYVDIAMDPVENYVEEEDPCKFSSNKTGRGPLRPGWQKTCEPVMTAYKLCTVDVPYWGIGPRLEKFISKNAQHKVLLEGHRKCFCWLDEWFGLTINDIRLMEQETAEALRKARALTRPEDDEEGDDLVDSANGDTEQESGGQPGAEASTSSTPLDHNLSVKATLDNTHRSSSRVPSRHPSRSPRVSDGDNSPRLKRRLSGSLAAPSVSVGFINVSALEVADGADQPPGEVPPMPAVSAGYLSPRHKIQPPALFTQKSGTGTPPLGGNSPRLPLSTKDPERSYPGALPTIHSCVALEDIVAASSMQAEFSVEVENGVQVLDRAIALAKAKAATTGSPVKSPAKVANASSPAASASSSVAAAQTEPELSHCVSVVDRLIAMFSQSK